MRRSAVLTASAAVALVTAFALLCFGWQDFEVCSAELNCFQIFQISLLVFGIEFGNINREILLYHGRFHCYG